MGTNNKQSHLIDARTTAEATAWHDFNGTWLGGPIMSPLLYLSVGPMNGCLFFRQVFFCILWRSAHPCLSVGNASSEWVKQVAVGFLHRCPTLPVEFSSLIPSSAPESILCQGLHLDSRTPLAALVTSFRALRRTQEGYCNGSEEPVAMMLLLFSTMIRT